MPAPTVDCITRGRIFATPQHGAAPLPINLGDLTASIPADLVAAYNDVMDRTAKPVIDGIKDLRSRTDGYSWAKLLTLGPIFGVLLQAPEETRRAIHSALNTLNTRMQQLIASRAQVLAGTLPIDKWIAAVNVVLDGLKTQAKDLSESTVWNAIVVQANDAAQAYKKFLDQLLKLPGDLGTGLKWGIPIAVGAVGILAILVVPKLLGGTTVVVGGRGTHGLGSVAKRQFETPDGKKFETRERAFQHLIKISGNHGSDWIWVGGRPRYKMDLSTGAVLEEAGGLGALHRRRRRPGRRSR